MVDKEDRQQAVKGVEKTKFSYGFPLHIVCKVFIELQLAFLFEEYISIIWYDFYDLTNAKESKVSLVEIWSLIH